MTVQIIDVGIQPSKIEQPANARERVLQAAEKLFMERGYAAITLRDIAEALDMRQASLYYHFPNGKEELYVAVVRTVFARHHAGIEAVLKSERGAFEEKLSAVARWFVQQSSVNLLGMMHADMPALSEESQEQLFASATKSIFMPIRQAIQQAVENQEIRPLNVDLVTGSFLSILDGIRYRSAQLQNLPPTERKLINEQMVVEIIDILINGMCLP